MLITGSANWTTQAFFGNCENILITSQKELVSRFTDEYESMWDKFHVPHEKNGGLAIS